jgi:hypothetical protein
MICQKRSRSVHAFLLVRKFHKDLTEVKLLTTHNPTITGKCDSSLMTSYQDVGLGERDQSLGLRGHATFIR